MPRPTLEPEPLLFTDNTAWLEDTTDRRFESPEDKLARLAGIPCDSNGNKLVLEGLSDLSPEARLCLLEEALETGELSEDDIINYLRDLSA